MTLWDVHTLPSAGLPVRHYQQYGSPEVAERMRAHLAGVLHVDLVVEQVDLAEPVAEVAL